jgi:hypothetical protein
MTLNINHHKILPCSFPQNEILFLTNQFSCLHYQKHPGIKNLIRYTLIHRQQNLKVKRQ